MTRFLFVAVAALLAGCGGATSQARASRAVTSQYNGWTIRVTPSATTTGTWRARVQAWPKDVSPTSHAGIALRFAQSASTEGAIVESAMTFARSFIDASTPGPGAGAAPAQELLPGRPVTSEHNGWTIRISPAGNPDSRVWRAGVQVWPPDRDPERQSGIQMQFTDVAADEKSIVESAIRSARRYIDASRTQHQ